MFFKNNKSRNRLNYVDLSNFHTHKQKKKNCNDISG